MFILFRDQDKLSQISFIIFFKVSIKYVISPLGYDVSKHTSEGEWYIEIFKNINVKSIKVLWFYI